MIDAIRLAVAGGATLDQKRDQQHGAQHRCGDQVRVAEELGLAVDERVHVVAQRAGCDGAAERCTEERLCGVLGRHVAGISTRNA